MQRKVAKAITGGLSSTAGDILDVHAYILPIDLLFCKLLFRAALQLCTLTSMHLLWLYRYIPLFPLNYLKSLLPSDIFSLAIYYFRNYGHISYISYIEYIS